MVKRLQVKIIEAYIKPSFSKWKFEPALQVLYSILFSGLRGVNIKERKSIKSAVLVMKSGIMITSTLNKITLHCALFVRERLQF